MFKKLTKFFIRAMFSIFCKQTDAKSNSDRVLCELCSCSSCYGYHGYPETQGIMGNESDTCFGALGRSTVGLIRGLRIIPLLLCTQ